MQKREAVWGNGFPDLGGAEVTASRVSLAGGTGVGSREHNSGSAKNCELKIAKCKLAIEGLVNLQFAIIILQLAIEPSLTGSHSLRRAGLWLGLATGHNLATTHNT